MSAIATFLPLGFNKPALLSQMEEQGLDYILLTSPENVYYTTGYTTLPSSRNPILYTLKNQFPFAAWITRDGKISLVCWGYSTYGVEFGVDEVLGFNDMAGALGHLKTLLQEAVTKHAMLGLESLCPYYLLTLYQELGGSPNHLRQIDGLIQNLRLIKSPAEIQKITTSVEIAEKTIAELYGLLQIGMSRLDLIQEAKYRAIRNGATGISHITISFGQENPEIGMAERLEPNKLLTLDVGAIYDGYCSDNRRYAFSGDVPVAVQERYSAMVEIIDAVGAALVPGTTYRTLHDLAERLHAEHGLQPFFNHVGHNMGLETEEQWVSRETDNNVQSGMVINLEMYVPVVELGASVGNEESYVIGRDGPQRISNLPRTIHVL